MKTIQKNHRFEDEILLQVWKEKDQHSEAFGNDLDKYFSKAKARESKSAIRIMNREKNLTSSK